jgi:hypothetical protein
MRLNEIYMQARLTPEEVRAMPAYITDDAEFYDTPAYEKLYEYFAFETAQMPYGTAKFRDGEADVWILEHLENLA